MNAGYKDYLQKGTLKILNKDSSLDINEEERTAIITAFADELTKNIGDTTKLKDCDLLVYSTLLSLTDEKLSSLLSDSNVSDDELVTGIALCEKIRKYLKVFADNNWTLPEIENSDPSKSASTIRKIQQTRLMRGRILEKDKQINDLIIRARKELSTKACDDVIELANKLNEDLDICKQKRIGIPQIENGDLKKLTAKVEEIRNGDKLYLDIPLRGAGGPFIEFADVDKISKTKKLKFSKNAKKWRKVSQGLNLFGKCINKKCEAYDNEVIYPAGINIKFDINLRSKEIKCPICSKNFIPLTLGFWKCEYQIKGEKLKDGEYISVNINGKETKGNDFEYYDTNETGKVFWSKLIIFVGYIQEMKYKE